MPFFFWYLFLSVIWSSKNLLTYMMWYIRIPWHKKEQHLVKLAKSKTEKGLSRWESNTEEMQRLEISVSEVGFKVSFICDHLPELRVDQKITTKKPILSQQMLTGKRKSEYGQSSQIISVERLLFKLELMIQRSFLHLNC